MRLQQILLIAALQFPGLDAISGPPIVPASDSPSQQFEQICRQFQSSPRETSRRNLVHFCERTKERQFAGLGYFLLGYSAYQKGEYDTALTYLRIASQTALVVEDFVRYFWAESLFKNEKLPEAKENLAAFLSQFPESPFRARALSLYWETCLLVNEPQAVLDSVANIPNIATNPDALFYRGGALEIMGQTAEAVENYQKLHFFFPLYDRNSVVAQKLSTLIQKDETLRREPPDEWKVLRIERLFLAKRYQDVLGDLRLIQQSDSILSRNPQLTLWEGISLFGIGRFREALERFRSYKSTDKELLAQAGFQMAECYRKLGDYAGFKQAVETLAQECPASKWLEEALFSLGNYNLVHGDFSESTTIYEKLVGYFPKGIHTIDAHWRVGWYYYRQNQPTRAFEKFQEHLERYKDSPHIAAALYWAGRCDEKIGKEDEASQIYDALSRRSPNSYYGLLARKRLSSIPRKGSSQLPSHLERLFNPLDLRLKVHEEVSWSHVQQVSMDSKPRVKALATIQLFDLAVKELQRQGLYGESVEINFLIARLYYLGRDFRPAMAALRRLIPGYQDVSFDSLPRTVWEMLYPVDFLSIIVRESRRQNLDPYWILSLIRQESAYDPNAISSANAHGLMQLLPGTARMVARQMKMGRPGLARLHDPKLNVRLGTHHFADLLNRCNGQMEMALASYNAGPERVQEWMKEGSYEDDAEFVETIPFSETRNYVKVISRGYWFYQALYGKESAMKPVGERKRRTSRKK